MKILVGIKHVPDTESKIKVGPDGRSIDPAGVKMVPSPYDEYALEEALRKKEAAGGGEVVLVGAGPQGAQASLRQGLAMGADRAVLVLDERYELADGLARARALEAVARSESPKLILLGKYGVGPDEGQTGPMLAELLGWPHVGGISSFELDGEAFTVHREIEGGVEVHEGRLPAVLTVDKGINDPRYPSLKGIMAAKKKPLETKGPEELGLDPAELAEGSRVVWESLELPPPRAEGKLIDGDVDQATAELVRLLREEAKVI